MMDEEKKTEETSEKPAAEEIGKKSGAYGKRPLWQWVVIYFIGAAIIYGLIYYFVFAKKGGYNYSSPSNTQQQNYSP